MPGVDPYALTSVDAVKRRAGIADSASDDLIAELIGQVGEAIERIAARRFVARDYRERHASTSGRIVLRHFPLIRLDRLACGRAAAMRLRWPAAALLASASVDESGLRLVRLSNEGQTTAVEFDFAGHPTTAQLAAAAVGAGWSARLERSIPSSDLLPTFAGDAHVREATLDGCATELAPRSIEPDGGVIELGRPAGDVLVEYRAGYATVPADVAKVATEMVVEALQGRGRSDVRAAAIGPYRLTLAPLDESRLRERLAPWIDHARLCGGGGC